MNDRRPALMVDLLLNIRGLASLNIIHLPCYFETAFQKQCANLGPVSYINFGTDCLRVHTMM